MSERIYAWLLRLFPADFRQAHGRDALELFRDRWRDERGLFLRLRLWGDLLADLMISVPSAHYRAGASSNAGCPSPEVGASPGFHLLAVDKMRPASLLFGSALTLLALSGLSTLNSDVNARSHEISGVSLETPLKAERDPTGTVPGVWLLGYSGTRAKRTRYQARPANSSGFLSLPWGAQPRPLRFVSEDLSAMKGSADPKDGPAFATISIKPCRSIDALNERMRVLPDGDLIAHQASVLSLLSFAYDVPANPSPRLYGVPDWSLERYDIEAKVGEHSTASGLSRKETLERARKMVCELLAERFSLVIHAEKKGMSVYALSVATGGVKLQKSRVEEACIFDTDPEGCHTFVIGFGHPLRARAVDMDDLAQYIENWADRPVVNRTGLNELFRLNTGGWLPMSLPPPPPGSTPNRSVFAGLPTVFMVLADLGLTLEKKDATVPVYTIEQIERPRSN